MEQNRTRVEYPSPEGFVRDSMFRVIELVDEALAEFAWQEAVNAEKVRNYLLDIRLECTTIPEQGGTDGELPKRTPALVGVDHTGPS